MTLSAIVMAGGRATRMGGSIEKPLLEVAGKSMLYRVVEVIKQSSAISRVIVATSSATGATARAALDLGVETIVTPGDGFEEDMRFVIRTLSLEDVLVVSADLPFITHEIVEKALKQYRRSGKPALAVMTKAEVYKKFTESKPQYVFKIHGRDLVPVGINLIDGRRIEEGELDQTILIETGDVTLNVNTLQELKLAKKKASLKRSTGEHGLRSNSQNIKSTYRPARLSVFVALSVVGSFIHLPSPIPTVAFDSAPGFFAALYFGPLDGLCVLGLGHLGTAVINGFPLGILHLPIAVGLAAAGAATGWISDRWSAPPAIATGVAINTALIVLAIPVMGLAGTLSFTPFLFLAASVNGILAYLVYLAVRRRLAT